MFLCLSQKCSILVWSGSENLFPSSLAVSLHPAVHLSICLLHGVWPQEEAGKVSGTLFPTA